MKFVFAILMVFSLSAMAATPSKGSIAAAKLATTMKTKDIRTIVTEVQNTDNNPCMGEGKSFNVELQVKMGERDAVKGVVYKWETVRTINVDKDGLALEVCAE